MSVVEDLSAEIARLGKCLRARMHELHQLRPVQQWNRELCVDVDANGQSVATLSVTVRMARKMLYETRLLSGKRTYVAAFLDPPHASRENGARLNTAKKPTEFAPRFQSHLTFHNIVDVHAVLHCLIMQEERLGSDRVVGAVQIPLSSFYDQRAHDSWHRVVKNGQETMGELYLSCRLDRSKICALELEIELLQNRLREMQQFAQMHGIPVDHSMSNLSQHEMMITVDNQEIESEVASLCRSSEVRVARKRERQGSLVEGVQTRGGPFTDSSCSGGVQHKRQKTTPMVEEPNSSLGHRLAEWLLPTISTETKTHPMMADATMTQKEATSVQNAAGYPSYQTTRARFQSWAFPGSTTKLP